MAHGEKIKCDAFGCNESHPLEHDAIGEPYFGIGKWLGWMYLDINRPDMFDRPLRFCSVACLLFWIGQNSKTESRIGPIEYPELARIRLTHK